MRWGEEGIAIQFRGMLDSINPYRSDKRSWHSHCYQVNDCQVTCIKDILLLKLDSIFALKEKYIPPFASKNVFAYKRRKLFFVCLQKVGNVSINAHHLLLVKSPFCNHLLNNNAYSQTTS